MLQAALHGDQRLGTGHHPGINDRAPHVVASVHTLGFQHEQANDLIARRRQLRVPLVQALKVIGH